MTIRPPRPEAWTAALGRMGLEPDGEVTVTVACRVGPVRRGGEPLFLKITDEPEERAGARALAYWDGHGAVRLIAADGDAFLLERGGATLRASAAEDADATRALCRAAAAVHAVTTPRPAGFVPIDRWFASLWADTDGRFDPARAHARALIDRGDDVVLMHGDVHSENLLDFGERGWLLIDPKGVVGPRAYDYGNVFTNWTRAEAVEHFDRRLGIVSEQADLDPEHLLRWIVAWSALSGVWHLEGGDPVSAAFPHAIMDLALDRLR